jgi:hypothetical protein
MVHSGHPVHWLTTRCRDGDSSTVVAVLGRLVQPSTVELLTSIKPTSWATSKLEAIDSRSPFIWFDDQPLQFEIEELQECGLLDRWVKVDLLSEPDQLGTLRMFGELRISGNGDGQQNR